MIKLLEKSQFVHQAARCELAMQLDEGNFKTRQAPSQGNTTGDLLSTHKEQNDTSPLDHRSGLRGNIEYACSAKSIQHYSRNLRVNREVYQQNGMSITW
jgi:hypothetical protein